MLCVHGNPTWSYLWRRFLAAGAGRLAGGRGRPARHGLVRAHRRPRTLAQRVDDLGALTDALGITGPVVTVAHDWGGPVSLGWALAHRDQLRGVVLTNTAVHQPAGAAAPVADPAGPHAGPAAAVCVAHAGVRPRHLRAVPPAAARGGPRRARRAVRARRPGGGRSATSWPTSRSTRPPERRAAGPASPRASATCRRAGAAALGPARPGLLRALPARPARPAAARRRCTATRAPPTWSPRTRRSTAGDVWRLGRGPASGPTAAPRPARTPTGGARRCGPALDRARRRPDARGRASWAGAAGSSSFADAGPRGSRDLAAGLAATGVRPGDRVALLVPPGADLTAAVYACWRAGAVDRGRRRGPGPARHGPGPARRRPRPRHRHRPGPGRGRAPCGCPGAGSPPARWTRATRRALGAAARPGRPGPARPRPRPAGAARRTTPSAPSCSPPAPPARPRAWSTATARCGPSCELLRATYGLTADDRLVAAFAPFALYGPALGIASAVPDMDVTAPGTLTAAALADAVGGRRRHRRLRLAGGAAQRRGHRGRPHRRSSARPWAASGC